MIMEVLPTKRQDSHDRAGAGCLTSQSGELGQAV
jgi:hypothetical protein